MDTPSDKTTDPDEHLPEDEEATLSSMTFLSAWSNLSHGWRVKWGLALFTFFVLIGFGAAIQNYVRLDKQRSREEMEAAVGAADVAMALKWTLLHQPESQRQNWSNPQFIQSQIIAMMTGQQKPINIIFGDGQSTSAPYLLRIFTNQNLSHFLIIAQPNPSLWQWLVPKHAIIIDSAAMELRLSGDFKTLNRLLAHPNPMERGQVMEIEKVLLQSKIISLPQLAKNKQQRDLAPPVALKVLRPGAENLIYNAPRYHEFGESLIRKALVLSDMQKDNEQKIQWLSDLYKLPLFRNYILYLPESLEVDERVEQVLTHLFPGSTFLLGSISYTESGSIQSSHLSLHHNSMWASALSQTPEIASISDHPFLDDPDEDASPLIREMRQIQQERKKALKWIYEEIVESLQHFQTNGDIEHLYHAKELMTEYEKEALIHAQITTQKLKHLEEQHPEISKHAFHKIAIESGLDAMLR